MRTFSKVFGMAGARVGFFMARPDIVQKCGLYDHGACVPVADTHGLRHRQPQRMQVIAMRRKEMMANRAMTVDFLAKHGLKVIGPSEGQYDHGGLEDQDGQGDEAAFKAQGVQIARPRWPVWPTVSASPSAPTPTWKASSVP